MPERHVKKYSLESAAVQPAKNGFAPWDLPRVAWQSYGELRSYPDIEALKLAVSHVCCHGCCHVCHVAWNSTWNTLTVLYEDCESSLQTYILSLIETELMHGYVATCTSGNTEGMG